MKKSKIAAAVSSVSCLAFALATPAQAGTVILEGSDAIGLHCSQDGDAGACTYENQVWKALDGSSGKAIAAIGNVPSVGSDGSGITVDNFGSVAAAAFGSGGLGQYAALYFISSSGCCSENDTLPAGNEAAIAAYLGAGGTVMIENYTGGAAWDFAVGTTGGAPGGSIAGICQGGVTCPSPPTSDFCDDGEMVTAVGMANGFTQPPAIGCWTHQSYLESFFGPKGFTLSFFDSPPGMVSGATTGWSSLLSSGVTLTGTPEPASFALIGMGMAGLGLLRLRRRKQ